MNARTRLLILGMACVPALACNALENATAETAPATMSSAQATIASEPVLAVPTVARTYGPTPSSVPLPPDMPRIERRPAPSGWSAGALTALPKYNPASTDPWQVDLRGVDLTALDLRGSLDPLLYASFDTRTRWPAAERMPPGFKPQAILEIGKHPGLGVRRLHAQGITGRNVGIAIIDQTLLVDHQQYVDRVQVYEETDDIRGGWLEPQMHGPAVASIAVGQTVGVAPEADLYFIASAMCSSGTHESVDFACLAQSVRRVLEVNEELPAGRKIRVLSMSIGWSPGNEGHEEMQAAATAARDAGLLVISSSVEDVHGFRFQGLGRSPLSDPNDFETYVPGQWWAEGFFAGDVASGTLMVPMESRTTASPGGVQEYAFYRSGGWSWSIPYIAGAYALAAQVRPDITPDLFWMTALGTGTTIDVLHDGRAFSLGPILNPEALIAALRAP